MYSQPVDVNVRILNAGAWSRTSEKIAVSLPAELEDLVPSIEEFYKRKHNGRKLQWNNLMSNGEWEEKRPYCVAAMCILLHKNQVHVNTKCIVGFP